MFLSLFRRSRFCTSSSKCKAQSAHISPNWILWVLTSIVQAKHCAKGSFLNSNSHSEHPKSTILKNLSFRFRRHCPKVDSTRAKVRRTRHIKVRLLTHQLKRPLLIWLWTPSYPMPKVRSQISITGLSCRFIATTYPTQNWLSTQRGSSARERPNKIDS